MAKDLIVLDKDRRMIQLVLKARFNLFAKKSARDFSSIGMMILYL